MTPPIRLRRWLRALPEQAPAKRWACIALFTALFYSSSYWLLLHDALQNWRHSRLTTAPTAVGTGPDESVLMSLRRGCDMATVKDIAQRHRLTPLVGQPVDEQTHGRLTVASAQMVVTGTFGQLQDFVAALSRHAPPLPVDHMRLGLSDRQRLALHARILCLHPSPREIAP